MKTIVFSIIALLIWFILWAYFSFRFIIQWWLDSVNEIISESVQDMYTWDVLNLSWYDTSNLSLSWSINDLSGTLEEKKQQLLMHLENKKEQIKNKVKDDVSNYIQNKIDSFFSGM